MEPSHSTVQVESSSQLPIQRIGQAMVFPLQLAGSLLMRARFAGQQS
jgi:hypothetical protein